MWCQTAPNDRPVLTCSLWLFLCFTEDTAASLCQWMVQRLTGIVIIELLESKMGECNEICQTLNMKSILITVKIRV